MTTHDTPNDNPLSIYDSHAWLRPIRIAWMPLRRTPAIDSASEALLDWFESHNCSIVRVPDRQTDLIITATSITSPVGRDESLLFNAKRRYRLGHRPQVVTIVDMPEPAYQQWLAHFRTLAEHGPADLPPHHYPGLGPEAVQVMWQQATRGGAEVAMGRFMKGFTKGLRVIALRHNDAQQPVFATHFDLAGSHPTTPIGADLGAFAEETALRLLAATCTTEVNQHAYADDAPLSAADWAALTTPDALVRAGPRFTEYGFFTDPVSVEKILGYRGLSEAISAHYSEGCYAAWDAEIGALVTTGSGSARMVDKRAISRQDQAILTGVKPDGSGALVRQIEGNERVVPSVEAVELYKITQAVGQHTVTNRRGERVSAPNVRAILHGHLGVRSYDPARVERLALAAPYYRHLVSCGTGGLAIGTEASFSASVAMAAIDEPRQIAFLEQPGHGIIVVEKWDATAQPFDLIQRALDEGWLDLTMDVPQGMAFWVPQGDRVVKREFAAEAN